MNTFCTHFVFVYVRTCLLGSKTNSHALSKTRKDYARSLVRNYTHMQLQRIYFLKNKTLKGEKEKKTCKKYEVRKDWYEAFVAFFNFIVFFFSSLDRDPIFTPVSLLVLELLQQQRFQKLKKNAWTLSSFLRLKKVREIRFGMDISSEKLSIDEKW